MMNEKIKRPFVFSFFERIGFLFFWLKIFYPKAKGISYVYQLLYFIPQKVFRINGRVKWPVHFTSLVLNSKNIEIGNNCLVGINIGCYVQGKGGIKIGNNFRMGPNVGIISANHDPNDYDLWIKTNPIEIGNNVWIGMNSVIMPGVKIGNNVIIGANSVVSSDIPSNSVAIGTPCKVIKTKKPYEGDNYS